MTKTSSNAKSIRAANRSTKSPAPAVALAEIARVLETATAGALRLAADQIDAAAKNKRDPSRVLQDLHAVLAGPLVGGLMISMQDLTHPLT